MMHVCRDQLSGKVHHALTKMSIVLCSSLIHLGVALEMNSHSHPARSLKCNRMLNLTPHDKWHENHYCYLTYTYFFYQKAFPLPSFCQSYALTLTHYVRRNLQLDQCCGFSSISNEMLTMIHWCSFEIGARGQSDNLHVLHVVSAVFVADTYIKSHHTH